MSYNDMKSVMLEETKRLFNPEFINRIDEIVVFKTLSKENIKEIIDITVRGLLVGLKERDIEVSLTPKAREFLTDQGYDPIYGARQVRRILRKFVEDPIAEELIKGRFQDGSHIQIKTKGADLLFEEKQTPPSKEKTLDEAKKAESEDSIAK